jgi:hypothetical protein
MLTGGEGYMFGTLFGVLTTALIQMLIQFNGKLSSWWTSIAIGVLTLAFIGIQSLLVNLNAQGLAAKKLAGGAKTNGEQMLKAKKRKTAWIAAAAVCVLVVSSLVFYFIDQNNNNSDVSAVVPTESVCVRTPLRADLVKKYVDEGAVITYERNGGLHCIDEVYAFFTDGRIIADNGTEIIEASTTPEKVDKLLTNINNMGWFTDNMYSTYHKPCDQCFHYNTTVVFAGQTKAIEAVDGGTDAPAKYWQMSGQITLIVPKFSTGE